MVKLTDFECINQNQMKKNKTKQLNDAIMKKYLYNIEATHFLNLLSIKNLGFIKLIFFFLLMVATQMVSAQNGSVKINVVDEFQKPIAGAIVSSVTNPDKSSITDVEGNVTLEIESLGFVKVFYNEREKMVSITSNSIRIALQKTDKKINVGYGINKTTDEITTSIDLAYSDKLEKSSLNNPAESLYGKIKGLMAMENAGEPWNRDPTLFIRGVGTSGNNRILVLVDGFERSISSLSLQDIDNVAVLKDGTDVAKYGLRGANGVILVTTKRGSSNSFNVDVSYDKGWNIPTRKPKFLDAYGYANAVNQASTLDGNAPVYSALDLRDFKSGLSPFSHPNVDWWKETLKDFGVTNNFNTSFYGGGKSINYFVSLNYQNERGLIDNTNLDSRYDSSLKYDRLNFRTNLDIQLTNTTKFIVDASGYIGGQNEPNYRINNNSNNNYPNSIMNAIYNIPAAAFPVKTQSGEWGGTQIYANNPVAAASSTGISKPNYRTLFANGKIIQDLSKWVKGLSAEAAVAYDNYASFFENRTKTFVYENVPFTRDVNGAVVFGTPQTFGTATDLTYSDSFGDQIRQATGIAKINYETKWNENHLSTSVLFQEDKRVNDGQYNTFLHQNFMSSASYAYKNRYFIDGVLSYSGTDILPKENRFGLFPAVSAGWIVNRENFLKNSKTINYLKLRGSWGMSGNDIMSPNLDQQAYDAGGTYYFGINNTTFNGIREGRLAAAGLTYESSEKINLGFNMEMFKDLSFSFDAFRDKRTNIILSTSGAVPSLIGVTAAFENAGEVLNQGFEGSIMWKTQVDKLKYFIGGNFTYAKNEIINMNEEYRPYDYLKETGKSIDQQFGLQSIGFFQNQADINNSPIQVFSPVRPGDVKYKDQNNDGRIDAFDVIAIGKSSRNPELYYAINFGFEMEGFGLDVLLQGAANQTLYLNTPSVFWPLVGQKNISEFSAGAWTPETAATATLPRLTMLSNDNNYRKNDIWLTSGNYLKMRHFEFYYNFPERLAKKLKMDKAKLYARGMNVFSIDNIKIVDPESIGVDYPSLASYHLGIKLEFEKKEPMKIQNYINYGLIFLLFFTFTNCEDLNYDETSFNRKETVFNDFARSKSFLTGIYAYLPTDFNSVDGAIRSTASDDAEHVNDLSDVQKFNDGTWSDIQSLDNVWPTMYAGIRASNVFLVESEGQTFQELFYNNTYKDILLQYKNFPFEARFLRAYFYFELAKRYKNIPLITTVLTPEEAQNVKQASFTEVVNFIVSECDAAAAVLPLSYANFASVKETGRVTKGAALALKARVLLYAASPLHNAANDVALWQKAASAAKAVIDLNTYALSPSYTTIVNNPSLTPGPELILERREAASNAFERRNFPIGFQGGGTGTCPTQNLVDAYEMSNTGLPITDLASRYNSAQPYSFRDPRLRATVILNATTWKTVGVETFFGGKNGLPLTNATKTGYYLRKYVIEAINLDPKLGAITTREHSWVLFRYGEILLNYAEAMNEAYGPETAAAAPLTLTAINAVNLIRRRAGMPNFPVGLSKDAFRTKLRNERRVELAFEDHRFWDTRRWKIGDQTKNIFAMNITRNANLSFNYEVKLLEVRPFEERMYLYPIPQSEIFKNKNLVQNNGW